MSASRPFAAEVEPRGPRLCGWRQDQLSYDHSWESSLEMSRAYGPYFKW